MRNSKKIGKSIIWDYDFKKMKLDDPKAKIWFLNRKLQFGQLEGIKKKDLEKYLLQLEINPYLRQLLENYLSQYGKKKSFSSSKRNS